MLVDQLVNCDTYALLYLLALFASFVPLRVNSLLDPTIVRTHVSTSHAASV